MGKIQMQTPLVEMDGDEMTRILWQLIKDELLLPFIDLKTEYIPTAPRGHIQTANRCLQSLSRSSTHSVSEWSR